MEVEKYEEEEQSTTPIEPHGFYTTGERLSNPLKNLGEQLNISINVQGKDFDLPELAVQQLTESAVLANRYKAMFNVTIIREPKEILDRDLASHLGELIISFSRAAAEAAALADADNYEISEELLQRDRRKLMELGSFSALVDYHNNKQKETGLNVARIDNYLADDPNYTKIRTLVDKGVIIDTAADFTPIHRTAKFRNLQVRMLPVYKKAVAGMHAQSKVLLFRTGDIPVEIYNTMHTANEYHWRPEPGKVAGRPLLDCSNCALGEIPLNSEETKELGIKRYQRVKLPTLKEILLAWDNYRQDRNLLWSEMWIFKADISGCFNQLHWSQESVRLMGFVLQAGILMIMLTCGFGVGVTPMVWSLIGDAMNRVMNAAALCVVFSFVDDYMGAGTYSDALTTQDLTHTVIRGVVGYEGLSVKKNVFSQVTEILGIQVNCIAGTLRPKDKALDKLFFVLFSIDMREAQSLKYWECISSLVTLYSPYMRGMRPFVAAINHMTSVASNLHKAKAKPLTCFALSVWRAAIIWCMEDPEAMSVSIDAFVRNPRSSVNIYSVVSDASPWRLCAALYHPTTYKLLVWAEYRLPYAKDIDGRHQGRREYLGYLLSLLLIVLYTKKQGIETSPFQYQWINDNKGALAWAHKDKCTSLASQLTCLFVSQIHMFTKIYKQDPIFLPGVAMGEIDKMSRMEDDETINSARIQTECPSLLHSLRMDMCGNSLVNDIFLLCDPSVQRDHEKDHLIAFEQVHAIIIKLML